MMNRKVKNILKKGMQSVFVAGQRAGVTILPSHFYSQIPNINELKQEKYWRGPRSMVGVSGIEIEHQLEFLQSICNINFIFPDGEIHMNAIKANGEDSGYGVIESDILYSFIRTHQPSKVIQIGCGVSTAVILKAAKDSGYQPNIVCVEPFPTKFLEELENSNQIKLVREKGQKVNVNILSDLGKNDFLFIDSTHTVKVGSEVNLIMLEVLPRLGPDTWIHFHDIYFPYDYGRKILSGDLFFWSESTLLHAFLINNSKCKLLLSQSMLHYYVPDQIKKIIPHYDPQTNDHGLTAGNGKHFPSATYLKTI